MIIIIIIIITIIITIIINDNMHPSSPKPISLDPLTSPIFNKPSP